MYATAQINIARPAGRKLVRDLEMHPKVARVDYPLPPEIAGQKWYTVEEVFSEVEEKLNAHYGSNLKLNY